MKWIDSHCHLPNDDQLAAGVAVDQTAAEQVAEAHSAGVTALIDIGTDSDTSTATCQRASRFEQVFATVGLHPHHAGPTETNPTEANPAEANPAEAQLGNIINLIETTPKADLVAVGECGLDYHYEDSPSRLAQQFVFAAQIELANRHQLALVIHSRDAWDDTFAVLDSVGVPERTVFHCFTGGVLEARRALERGAVISFSGIVSFKNAEDVRGAAAYVPADRFLVETDAPYLAPVPNRGKTNQPSWVTHVGEAMAQARNADVADVAAASTQTARQVFRLP